MGWGVRTRVPSVGGRESWEQVRDERGETGNGALGGAPFPVSAIRSYLAVWGLAVGESCSSQSDHERPMTTIYHYPPDLLQLLVDTVPRLCRSKQDQLLFYKGAGVGDDILADLRLKLASDKNSIGRYEIARTVLGRLNDRGDAALAPRREIVKRVVEFEDFSRCWENDRLQARGLVAEVQRLVNVRDSFTRMKNEVDGERKKRIAEQEEKARQAEQRKTETEALKAELFALFAETNAQVRGKRLEGVLNRLFAHFGILVREAFTRIGTAGQGVVEQIDGVIELDGEIYLVEMKWWDSRLGPGDVAQHLTRVYGRADCRGLIISAAGYTPAAIDCCREALRDKTVVLAQLSEIVRVIESGSDLRHWLKKKVEAAIIHKNPLYEPLS